MTQANLEAVQAILTKFKDPETGRALSDTQQVRDLKVNAQRITATLELTTHSAPLWEETREALTERLQAAFPEVQVELQLATHQRPPVELGQLGLKCKTVIAVGSGKGGVGKSTIATCLAMALHRAGCKAGLMDADVYGPSLPHLTGTTSATPDQIRKEDNRLEPVRVNGMPIMSIGYMVPPDQAVIWRGPMLHQAVMQFLGMTEWGELDYLIIDLPPGTGDIVITLSQALPRAGAVVVCTPQEVALLDAVKAISMFRRVNIPIVGMVENMSGFISPDTQTRYDIFGSGGARAKAEELNVPFLGEVPVVIDIRANGDAGRTMANFDNPQIAPLLRENRGLPGSPVRADRSAGAARGRIACTLTRSGVCSYETLRLPASQAWVRGFGGIRYCGRASAALTEQKNRAGFNLAVARPFLVVIAPARAGGEAEATSSFAWRSSSWRPSSSRPSFAPFFFALFFLAPFFLVAFFLVNFFLADFFAVAFLAAFFFLATVTILR